MAPVLELLEGVDVASFQGPPQQWEPEAHAAKWVAVKLTERQPDGFRYVNPDARADWARAAVLRLGRIAYLFAHPSTPVKDTVDLFDAVLTEVGGLDDGDGIAIDLEETDGLTPAEVNAWTVQVANEMHARFGRWPLLYTYRSFAEAGNCASLGHLPLWLSDPSSPAGHPVVPAPWHRATIHQYSTGGVIDRDVAFFADVTEMREALGKSGWVTYRVTSRESLVTLARNCGTLASTILRKTVDHFGVFEPPLLEYVNAGNLKAPLPRGVVVLIPAGSLTDKPSRARLAVHQTVKSARSTATKTATAVRAEPVVTATGTLGVLSAALVFLLAHVGIHLNVTQENAGLTILTALAGIWTAVRARPARLSVAAGLVGTIATAAAAFGLHLSPQVLGAEMPLISIGLGLLLRVHLSPKAQSIAVKVTSEATRLGQDFENVVKPLLDQYLQGSAARSPVVYQALIPAQGGAAPQAAVIQINTPPAATAAPRLPVSAAPGTMTVTPPVSTATVAAGTVSAVPALNPVPPVTQ